MIIERYMTPDNVWRMQERLGTAATADDARTALGNLIAAGWLGYDTIDIPDEVFFGSAFGPVSGPEL